MKQNNEKKQNNQNNQNNQNGQNNGKKHWNRHRPRHGKKPQKSEENKVQNENVAAKAPEPVISNDDLNFFSDFDDQKPKKEYHFTKEELDAVLEGQKPVEDDRPRTEVIGIRFKKIGKMYYFAPNGITAKVGSSAIVETARGLEFGQVCLGNTMVLSDNIVQPLRPIIRLATDADIKHYEENSAKEKEAFHVCLEKIAAHELDMKLVDAQYTFDNSKLVFYFTSSGRVDFRELVKDLASYFHVRIELRQIGIRDEAKLMGGLGSCGRPLCCASFLSDFTQVSIKMAKEQSLSLNSVKISGACGRLMCCLRYEHDTYVSEIAQTPPVDSIVDTPDGRGTVTEINPLAGTIKVKVTDKQDNSTLKVYKRELCKVIKAGKSLNDEDDKETDE